MGEMLGGGGGWLELCWSYLSGILFFNSWK